MKCVRIHEFGDSDRLCAEQVERPAPGEGEVLIAIAGAAVNPVDTKMRRGLLQAVLPINLPFVPGADFAGTIVATGPGVDEARIGQRVMGMVDVQRGGAYAECMTVPVERAVPVPDELDLIEAAGLPMGVMTGTDLVELGLVIKPGDKVAVTGAAGSVGRAAVFEAARQGAEVIALVRSIPQFPIAGASRVIEVADRAAMSAAAPFDCVADTVGGEVSAEVCTLLRKGGQLATAVGALSAPPSSPDLYSAVGVVVKPRQEALLRFVEALSKGQATVPPVLRLPLDQAARAHDLVSAGGTGRKVVLVPGADG